MWELRAAVSAEGRQPYVVVTGPGGSWRFYDVSAPAADPLAFLVNGVWGVWTVPPPWPNVPEKAGLPTVIGTVDTVIPDHAHVNTAPARSPLGLLSSWPLPPPQWQATWTTPDGQWRVVIQMGDRGRLVVVFSGDRYRTVAGERVTRSSGRWRCQAQSAGELRAVMASVGAVADGGWQG